MNRYIVSTWHGENGSIAEVRDRKYPDECPGIYSTARYGAEFSKLAREHAERANKAEADLSA